MITTCSVQELGPLSGIAMGYKLDNRGVPVAARVLGISLFTTVSSPALRLTQPPIQWKLGALSLGKAAGA
jgi:hypothetical protein